MPNISKKINILLVCALQEEFEEVKNVTNGLIQSSWHESKDSNGWIIADGHFKTEEENTLLCIKAVCLPYMGREQAQAFTSQLIQSNPPSCIVMTGICAGRRGKVFLGDVIFADRFWSYDVGKLVVEEGISVFQGDMLQYRPSLKWVQRMKAFNIDRDNNWLKLRPTLSYESQENWVLLQLFNKKDPLKSDFFEEKCPDWTNVYSRLKSKRGWIDGQLCLTDIGMAQAKHLSILYPKELPVDAEFQTHVAPMATGSSVVEDDDIFTKLATSMRKVLGLDMEASALAALGEAHDIPVLVAKGVSDYGDILKDDRYRYFAARASAEIMIAVLQSSTDLFKESISCQKTKIDEGLGQLPLDLIEELANTYTDAKDARALWQKAGGMPADIENARPKDMWQSIWSRCVQGAVVRPQNLLQTVLLEYPHSAIFQKYFNMYK